VDGSALRLRSCLLFNASEYSQDGQEGVRSVPSSFGRLWLKCMLETHFPVSCLLEL
jgi:hypothetical protein